MRHWMPPRLNVVLLKTLNTCHCNRVVSRSVILKSLPSVISALTSGFRRSTLRPRFPKCPTSGCAKPESVTLLGLSPCVLGWKCRLIGPATSGLWDAEPPSSSASVRPACEPENRLIGTPDCAWKMPPKVQPRTRERMNGFDMPAPHSGEKLCAITTRCGTSNAETARLLRLLNGSCCPEVSLARIPRASETSSIDFE